MSKKLDLELGGVDEDTDGEMDVVLKVSSSTSSFLFLI